MKQPALSRLHCLDLDEAGQLPPDWQAHVAALAADDVRRGILSAAGA